MVPLSLIPKLMMCSTIHQIKTTAAVQIWEVHHSVALALHLKGLMKITLMRWHPTLRGASRSILMSTKSGVVFSRSCQLPKLKSSQKLWSHLFITRKSVAISKHPYLMNLIIRIRVPILQQIKLPCYWGIVTTKATQETHSTYRRWLLITLTTIKWSFWSHTKEILTTNCPSLNRSLQSDATQ